MTTRQAFNALCIVIAAFAADAAMAAALTANAQSTVRPLTQDDAPLADQAATDIKDVKPSGPRKFKRVWTFADARDEDFVRKLAALNVQNVGAMTPEKVALAKKYGMLPYVGAGAASGTHGQVMTAAETNALHALNGEPPPSSLSKEERAAWLKEHDEKRRQRLIACRYSFGGEPEPGREKDDVLQYGQPCFVGPVGRSNSVARVLASLDKNPEAEMVLFDFVGYQNYRRCHHPECESLYREYLAKNDLADTPENEKEFFLSELVAVNNAMHDAIKARNPKTVTGTHLYPVFLPEPLYGYRLKLDVIFETCAWYLKWPDEKIKAYATDCLTRKCADYPRARRIPFIAVTRGNWCEQKTAADVERELNDLLDAGVDEICAFEMTAIVDDPELYSVFLKCCGKD